MIKSFKELKNKFYLKLLNINWDIQDVFVEEDEPEVDYLNCRRHGGVANIINCWECYAEAKEDDEYPDRDEEDEDDDS